MTREQIVEKWRADFEDMWFKHYNFDLPELHPSKHRRGDLYNTDYSSYINTAWWGYKAALDSLEIDLPQPDQENDLHQYEAKVIDAIEAQGLKVKP